MSESEKWLESLAKKINEDPRFEQYFVQVLAKSQKTDFPDDVEALRLPEQDITEALQGGATAQSLALLVMKAGAENLKRLQGKENFSDSEAFNQGMKTIQEHVELRYQKALEREVSGAEGKVDFLNFDEGVELFNSLSPTDRAEQVEIWRNSGTADTVLKELNLFPHARDFIESNAERIIEYGLSPQDVGYLKAGLSKETLETLSSEMPSKKEDDINSSNSNLPGDVEGVGPLKKNELKNLFNEELNKFTEKLNEELKKKSLPKLSDPDKVFEEYKKLSPEQQQDFLKKMLEDQLKNLPKNEGPGHSIPLPKTQKVSTIEI